MFELVACYGGLGACGFVWFGLVVLVVGVCSGCCFCAFNSAALWF